MQELFRKKAEKRTEAREKKSEGEQKSFFKRKKEKYAESHIGKDRACGK